MRTLLKIIATVALLTAATAYAGCFRCAPILNIADAPVTTVSGKPLSEEQVRAAIIRAGVALGWRVADVEPGKLVATINLRTHTAVVAIAYSAEKYSITYKSSINLDEADGEIHKNYNGWIQNLSNGIVAQLSLG